MSNYTKYQIAVKQQRVDGGEWEDVVPFTYVRSGQTIPNSEDCGYVVEYRWYDAPIDEMWDCDEETYTKYQITVKQYRINGGEWTIYEPIESARTEGGIIELRSSDCGCCRMDYTVSGSSRKNTYVFEECYVPERFGQREFWNYDFTSLELYCLDYVGEAAFCGQRAISSVTLTDIGYIDYAAFHSNAMTNLQFNNVGYIGEAAFKCCYCIKKLTIPDSVGNIEASAFESCIMLSSVTINNVGYIGDHAFAWSIIQTYPQVPRKVTIGDNVTSIGKSAFYECSGMTSVVIGNGVTSIGNNAFYKCKKLLTVTFGESIETIGSEAFRECILLREITIPNSVTSIGSSAFTYCSAATSVTLSANITEIPNEAFYECDNITSITIPECVTRIGDRAFEGCNKLKEVTIPSSVTDLGYRPFINCSSVRINGKIGTLYCSESWYNSLSETTLDNLYPLTEWDKVFI